MDWEGFMARQLSKHFTLEELCKSQVAARHGIDNMLREPDDAAIIENLTRVCEQILEPVRDHYGMPFSPSSGYRCPMLNRTLKSKDTSQHIKGEAIDFEVPGVANPDLADWIYKNLTYDQLILEYYEPGVPTSGWVHCSVTEKTNRHDELTINTHGAMKGLVA
jgi:uncharacterized protein YcbK (DUF882 family)